VWKFAGLNPNIRWSEDDFDKVFASGRDSYGDEVDGEAEGTGISREAFKQGDMKGVEA